MVRRRRAEVASYFPFFDRFNVSFTTISWISEFPKATATVVVREAFTFLHRQ